MKKKTISIFLLLTVVVITAAGQKVIAHRGFWKSDGSAQNSIAALIKADSIAVYGSEVDIWLSADGVPVVNHDADVTLDGAKLLVQETPASTLRRVVLSNGEPMPTMEEYLDAFVKCRNTKLIIEFKTHKSKEREDELARKVIQMVNERELQGRVEYISFGLNFVNQIRQLAPETAVYYLNGDLEPPAVHDLGAAGIDYHHTLFTKHPEWVEDAQNLGLKVNTWTVNTPEDINRVIDLKVDFITTDEPLLTRQLIDRRK